MSVTSQGPGWWLASDGKWYPPQLHPSLGPPPPPPPSAVGRSPGTQFASPPVSAAGGWSTPSPGLAAPAPWAGQYAGGVVDPLLGLPLAPWWKRLVAFIVDGIVLGIGLFFVFLVIGIVANASRSPAGAGGSTTTSSQAHGAAVLVGLLIIVLLGSIPFGLYYGLMNGRWRGQTVGKLALSIAVRDARTGALIGFWRGFGRYMITIVFWLLLFVPYLLDSLAPLWNKRRQAWHDEIVHSVVVDLKP
jgi:uncharacterized RDD family membrane protein YckC